MGTLIIGACTKVNTRCEVGNGAMVSAKKYDLPSTEHPCATGGGGEGR